MKRFLFLCNVAILLSLQIQAQSALPYLIKYPYKIIEGKWETNPYDKGKKQLNYYNSDKCPYYLYVTNQKQNYFLMPGKTTVLTKNANDPADLANRPGTFRFYRGVFPKKLDLGFVYSIPLASGKAVEWMPDPRERVRTFLFKTSFRDTVFASRTGTVCHTEYKGGILVYHNDDTFAAYMNLSESLVYPGETVKVGDPIALTSHGGVSLSIFFLDENLFSGGVSKGYAYTHFSPLFRTDAGDIKLQQGEKYMVVRDDRLMMQEMTKGEIKKYLKRKKQ